MKRFSSHKGISGLSPHNILYSIYYRKAVKRMRYVIFVWRGSVSTESLASLTRMVSSVSSLRFLRHFRVPINPLKGHIMGRLLSACGTEQDITQEMVLYQRVSRPFLHRFSTDRVDCMKPLCHAGTQKKRPAVRFNGWSGRQQVTFLSLLSQATHDVFHSRALPLNLDGKITIA